jgi:phosphatidylinositol alpha 1,6-mannosyltransferase
MTEKIPRVAFFPDSYLEVNGAAMTCRRLVGFAETKGYPFFCIHAGEETSQTTNGSVTHLSLKRSPIAIPMDEGLKYDPLFNRHINRVKKSLEAFKPDVLHLTGLNDVSIIAAIISHQWQLPLVGSWHTNLHEFASRRLDRMFRFLPDGMRSDLTGFAEKWIFKGSVYYYRMPKVVLSPNQELVELLGKGSGRESLMMTRGVDSDFFSPAKRTVNDGIFRLGFVGRLRAEKNVRLLVDLEKRLIELGKTNFKFVIIGEGNEREYLEKALKNAEFTGFLDGEKLADAYANLDIFVFPSETDAFGNVIQEAHSSGVPAIVSHLGGPKFIIKENETGFVAKNLDDFVRHSVHLMDNPQILELMKKQSRDYMDSRSWDAVFESVYKAYDIAYAKRSPKMREW